MRVFKSQCRQSFMFLSLCETDQPHFYITEVGIKVNYSLRIVWSYCNQTMQPDASEILLHLSMMVSPWLLSEFSNKSFNKTNILHLLDVLIVTITVKFRIKPQWLVTVYFFNLPEKGALIEGGHYFNLHKNRIPMCCFPIINKYVPV